MKPENPLRLMPAYIGCFVVLSPGFALLHSGYVITCSLKITMALPRGCHGEIQALIWFRSNGSSSVSAFL